MHKAQKTSTPRNLYCVRGRVARYQSGLSSHLNRPGLELAEGRGGSGCGTILGDESGHISAEVAEGSKEDEAIDGLVEAPAQEEGREDEENAEEGSDGADPLSDLDGIDLICGEFAGHGDRRRRGWVEMGSRENRSREACCYLAAVQQETPHNERRRFMRSSG